MSPICFVDLTEEDNLKLICLEPQKTYPKIFELNDFTRNICVPVYDL